MNQNGNGRHRHTLISGDANSLFREKRIDVKYWATLLYLLRGQTGARPGDTLPHDSSNLCLLQFFFSHYTAIFQISIVSPIIHIMV